MLLLPLAANYTVKNISIAVVDHDHSTFSRRLIPKITSSGYFTLTGYTNSYREALTLVEEDKADLALQIPVNFERDLISGNSAKVYMAIDAIDGTKASLGGAYLNSILRDFNADIRANQAPASTAWVSAARPVRARAVVTRRSRPADWSRAVTLAPAAAS